MLKQIALLLILAGAGFYLFFNLNNLDLNIFKASILTDIKGPQLKEVDQITQDSAKEEWPSARQENEPPAGNFIVKNEKVILAEIQEDLDDISEKIDTLSREIAQMARVLGAEDIKEEIEEDESGLEEETKEVAEDEDMIKELEKNAKEALAGRTLKLCEIYPGITPLGGVALINEVAWMGNLEGNANEWVELKNFSGLELNMAGWQLLDLGGQIKIFFEESNLMSVGGFYLLERTDDQTLPGIEADKIYTGALKNEGESLYLFDEDCQLLDSIQALAGWPAGDNASKGTMERNSNLGWQTSHIPGGTPKKESSQGFNNFGGGGAISLPPSLPVYPKILISEVYIEEKEDFVELYNPNNEDISLADWYLQRKTKGADSFSSFAPQDLFNGRVIRAKDYFLIANASSGLLADATTSYPLTQDNTLVLKNPARDVVDLVGWGNSQEFETATTTNPEASKSTGRKWSTTSENYIDSDNNYNDFEAQTPSPKIRNESPAPIILPATTTEPATTIEPIFPMAIVINEIAWMGTASSSANEWIELYNNTDSAIDLGGWTLRTIDGGIDIIFSTTSIPVQGYFLLERTDDGTIPDILADLIYTGPLGNSGEKLELKDASNNLIDTVDCSLEWFSGDNTTKQTMERITPLSAGDAPNWAPSALPGGTPKLKNSVSP